MAGAGIFPKLQDDVIYAADHNAIRTVINGVVADYYGNSISSQAVAVGDEFQDLHMDRLRTDINRAYRHITGSDSTINDIAEEGVLLYTDWNAYKATADYCETNKNTVHATQLSSQVYSGSLTSSWSGTKTWSYTFTWASAALATYFFNTGGKFVIDLAGANSLGTAKDNMWLNDILNAAPTQTYSRTNWATPTNIAVDQYGSGVYYSSDYVRISAVKTDDRTVTVSITVNSPDTLEPVGTDVLVSVARYVSVDAITATPPTAVQTSNWGSTY